MAMLILGIGVAIGLQVLGHRYEQIVNVDEATQRRLFTEALPNDRVPVGIRSRLESECAKLAGATGAVTELPQTFSALETLQRILSQLPTEMRIRVNDLRVQEESVVLRGEVRRYGDSDAVAAALRERGFVVEPVQTERLPNEGVGLTVTAQIDESNESRTK